MARSLTEQLDDCDAAISAIETGAQEYYIGSRRVRRGDLAAMYKRRDQLQAMVDRESGAAPIFSLATVDRPR